MPTSFWLIPIDTSEIVVVPKRASSSTMATFTCALIFCLFAVVLAEIEANHRLTSFGPHYHVKITTSQWPTYQTNHLEHWYDGINERSRTDFLKKDTMVTIKTYRLGNDGTHGSYYALDFLHQCWKLRGTELSPVHPEHRLPRDISADFRYVGKERVDEVDTEKYIKVDWGFIWTTKETLWARFQMNVRNDEMEPVPVKYERSKIVGFFEWIEHTSFFSDYSSGRISHEVFQLPEDCPARSKSPPHEFVFTPGHTLRSHKAGDDQIPDHLKEILMHT